MSCSQVQRHRPVAICRLRAHRRAHMGTARTTQIYTLHMGAPLQSTPFRLKTDKRLLFGWFLFDDHPGHGTAPAHLSASPGSRILRKAEASSHSVPTLHARTNVPGKQEIWEGAKTEPSSYGKGRNNACGFPATVVEGKAWQHYHAARCDPKTRSIT